MHRDGGIGINFSSVGEEFDPVSGFVSLLQHGPHFRDEVRLGLCSMCCSVVCPNRCSCAQQLPAENSACFVFGQALTKFDCGQCKLFRAIQQIIGSLHGGILHSTFLILHSKGSPKLSSLRAARRQPAIFIWGRGRQAMHLPCKQAYVGALPTDSTSLRPLRCGGRRLPRRSSESGGGHYVPQSSGLRLGGPISTAGNSTNAQREAS